MNVVHFSPNFPPNFIPFAESLAKAGVSVLGLGEDPYEALSPRLQSALAGYRRVGSLHDYDQCLRALGGFIQDFGRLDRLESFSEYWLRQDAALRTDFNIPGLKSDGVDRVKRKSIMKRVFEEAGAPVCPGVVAKSRDDLDLFLDAYGFPLIAKPDEGVGAAGVFRLDSREDLDLFWSAKPDLDYFIEPFIEGRMITYDGFADAAGSPVLSMSMEYSQGIMETVNQDLDVYYWTARDIPPDVEELGRSFLEAFDVRERFFHFEFFRTKNGGLLAVEINLRPPGGWTTDVWNFALDADVYAAYADAVLGKTIKPLENRPRHGVYISRKWNKHYALSHEDLMARWGSLVVHHAPIEPIFARALGDYGYILRTPDENQVHAAAKDFRQKVE